MRGLNAARRAHRARPAHRAAGAARSRRDAGGDHPGVAALDRAELETAVGTDLVFSHGDCHLAKVVVDGDTPGLTDWQSARLAPACPDLALTRAVPTGTAIPRDLVITRHAARRSIDPDAFERAVTAQQLLTLVWQYPAFAGCLSTAERDRLRATLRSLAARWLHSGGVSGSG